MSTTGSAEGQAQTGTRRFISGVVEGEQTGTRTDLIQHVVRSLKWCITELDFNAGFYGRPWTMEQRTELFKRYVKSVEAPA